MLPFGGKVSITVGAWESAAVQIQRKLLLPELEKNKTAVALLTSWNPDYLGKVYTMFVCQTRGPIKTLM